MTTYGSVCSGIEAASVAWQPLGWEPAWLAEIEPFPSAVLAHHYPEVPNLGDMTAIADRVLAGEAAAPDVLCGGTPCQAFSVAGLRKGLNDARGQLSLEFCRLADAVDSVRRTGAVVIWENVPGVLSDKANAFGCFLGALSGEEDALEPPGGRWTNAGAVFGPKRAVAWRILDAQYFGVAQRRRRVWVVASARAGFDPAAVIFEREGVRRDTAPSREAREGVAADVGAGSACCSNAEGSTGLPFLTSSNLAKHGNNQQPLVAFQQNQLGEVRTNDVVGTLNQNSNASGRNTPLVAFHAEAQPDQLPGPGRDCSVSDPLTKSQHAAVAMPMCVRRLTPTECEFLMGFPRNYTAVPYRNKPAADGPRYKALGNSWAVPCARWIGERIQTAMETP